MWIDLGWAGGRHGDITEIRRSDNQRDNCGRRSTRICPLDTTTSSTYINQYTFTTFPDTLLSHLPTSFFLLVKRLQLIQAGQEENNETNHPNQGRYSKNFLLQIRKVLARIKPPSNFIERNLLHPPTIYIYQSHKHLPITQSWAPIRQPTTPSQPSIYSRPSPPPPPVSASAGRGANPHVHSSLPQACSCPTSSSHPRDWIASLQTREMWVESSHTIEKQTTRVCISCWESCP